MEQKIMNHDQKRLIDILCRVEMYVYPYTLEAAIGFVGGFDSALDGMVLDGFREWLVKRLGKGSNMGWMPLVIWLAIPHSDTLPSCSNITAHMTEEDAILFFVDLLYLFFGDSETVEKKINT